MERKHYVIGVEIPKATTPLHAVSCGHCHRPFLALDQSLDLREKLHCPFCEEKSFHPDSIMLAPREVPSWDDFFLALAFAYSSRSKDPSTQHGCVLVSPNHQLISAGVNGAGQNIEDDKLDWSRESKLEGWKVIHSEENAIYFADRDALKGAVAYVTGWPCPGCTHRLVHNGIKRIVFGGRKHKSLTEEAVALTRNLAELGVVELVERVDFTEADARSILFPGCDLESI